MINVSAKVNRPKAVVWKYFIKPENWIHWYGGTQEVGIASVEPGWQEDGRIEWSTAGDSPIYKFVDGEELEISTGWTEVTWRFKPDGDEATLVELSETDPRMASYPDGGAAAKANWQVAMRKFKECVEAGD